MNVLLIAHTKYEGAEEKQEPQGLPPGEIFELVLAFADDRASGGKCDENNQEWRKNQGDIEKSMVKRGEEGEGQHGQNGDADAERYPE